jgi:hypothetical protein
MSPNLIDSMIEITAGAIGGNIVGEAMKDTNLGVVGNTLVGAIGGYAGVLGFSALFPAILDPRAGSIGLLVVQWLMGGVSGAIFTALVSLIKICVMRIVARR